MEKVLKERDRVLKILADKMDGFYLAGGTALSLFYFQHRDSYDLDFFTKDFSKVKIERVVFSLADEIGRVIELKGEQLQKDRARILVFSIKIDNSSPLKLDFVEDVFNILSPFKKVDGIDVLSLEDIYIRKIFAACGSISKVDGIGREISIGGRQEARDLFDLFYLSKTFMPLSDFAFKHCNATQRASIVVWQKTYDRFEMKCGLNEIKTDKEITYQEMEKHLDKEIEKMIKRGIQK